MPRYIDADEFIKRVIHYSKQSTKTIGLALKDTPTADVVERKRGKWIVCNILDFAQRPTGRKVGRCSNCGHLTDEFRTMVEASKKLTNFCSECGSYNGEGDENE